MCDHLFQRCLPPLTKALFDSNYTKDQIDEVILVGGSTRIPKIPQMLSDFFDGKQINKVVNLDEVVARGATLQAGILAGAQAVGDIEFKDILPISIGVKL